MPWTNWNSSDRFVRLISETGPSMLSLAAAGIYIAVALACVTAARAASTDPRFSYAFRVWVLASAFFVLLAMMRAYSVEDFLRDQLRTGLIEFDARDNRRVLQAIALFLVSVTGAILCRSAWIRWKAATGNPLRRAVLLANFAIVAMVGLILLRVISLHAMDAILFRGLIGSIRLNWILDLGLSLTVCVSAIQFGRKLRRKTDGRG